MNTLKQAIKEIAAGQTALKNQKKTVNLQGVRTMSTFTAHYTHKGNREKLRVMYMAYGILRGRTKEEVEPTSKTEINMHDVNELIKKYENEFKSELEQLLPSELEHFCSGDSNKNGGA